jgi:hypothetical protein
MKYRFCFTGEKNLQELLSEAQVLFESTAKFDLKAERT